MLKKVWLAVCLAARDWRFERSLTLCAILALASMLTPLLVLQGLKNGVIEGMRERLLQDPTVLIITPKSDGGRFTEAEVRAFGELPGAAFAIGRTRDTATDITLAAGADGSGKSASLSLEPSAPGEPVLAHLGITPPADGAEPGLVLSAPAAQALGAGPGASLLARLGRRTPEGRLESARMVFRVTAVLPEAAADRRMAFAPLSTLQDLEDYRDYLEVPSRGFTGTPREGGRRYASFRLYARDLDAVEGLATALGERHIETRTRSREIAAIRMLESSINQVILIISLAVGAGFAAFTISSVQGAVERKRRMLGMLRLLGFPHAALVLYPMAQSLLTSLSGFGLSCLLYLAVSLGIAQAFAGQGGIACRLGPADVAIACAAVVALSLLSTARAARAAAAVEPSIVIREV
ncbi:MULTISPECIES: FtsX-like permease family protein [unclassified Desulfovibrio]|uniref:ABC transporter permease n=1 Tax=unclassified Desulfovibrio TaxID=2593640 RepID=UPI0013E9F483|nr:MULTISPECIES: FtsX-like permease family protein [unclassified Desulfovibrio]